MSFPRQYARTRRFSLGVPRGFRVTPDGRRVAFLRSRGGTDPVTCLWMLEVSTGQEHLVADPRTLDVPGEEDLPPQERARRERAREQAGGIVSFATDTDFSVAVFTLSGRLYAAPLPPGDSGDSGSAGPVRKLAVTGPAFDPRPDPTGQRIAYVSGGSLRTAGLAADEPDRALAEPETPYVSYGLAEFIAAEEMGRMRGYWWAPDGTALLTCRVDESPVQRWHIADPANPGNPPTEIAYPAAGTANAEVSLMILRLDGEPPVTVEWARDRFPYLVTAGWRTADSAYLVVQTRDQSVLRLLAVDPATGQTTLLREDTDRDWVDIVPGVPGHTDTGALVWTVERDGARRLTVDGQVVTPNELQVRSVLDVDGDTVLFTASREPTEVDVWTYGPDGLNRLSGGGGVFSGCRTGGTTVVTGSVVDRHGVDTRVFHSGQTTSITSYAETPQVSPRVEVLRAGRDEIRTAVLLPTGYEPDSGPLPVLLDPYGGPHAQRVMASQRVFYTAQWLADQGFAVVIADGRGTPGRGPAWDRAVRGDLAGPVLDDQITALEAAAERHPLDLSRVGIRGWSFGGYLAALAVLRRPDVFHAAIAGAPVTDWRLYDTHYTERYLGHPDKQPENYDACSLLTAVAEASTAGTGHGSGAGGGNQPATETRPLLLIHGLADDNVVAAHTLRLSSALLSAGRPHDVLPLSGVTHMTPQEVVAENLLLLQVDFLRTALASAR